MLSRLWANGQWTSMPCRELEALDEAAAPLGVVLVALRRGVDVELDESLLEE